MTQQRAYFSQPAISPDLKEIAFVSGGDIWTVPSEGGVARLLVSNPATESRPLYSPDGSKLAFVSTRTGGGDIYVLDMKTGNVRRVTYDDGYEQLDAWSYDGRWLYFSTTSHDISYMNDVYRVRADGGTPMPVTAERYTNEYFSAPSPDGKSLAFTARGIDSVQWWRK
ncbi:MAG: DPP IV N-terminal domain-containing protein, partial [Blastocatellia bacterium]